MEPMTISTGLLVTVGTFLLSHLILAIWFASKMRAEVTQISHDVATVTEAVKDMAKMETRVSLLAQRLDRLEQDVRTINASLISAAQPAHTS